MSFNCVFGIAAGNASRFRRLCVACSYANANPTSLNSLKAVPMNDIPKGMPGAFAIVGLAGDAVKLSGWNPRGTVMTGYPAIAAGPAVNPN